MNMNAASSISQLFYSYISPTTTNNDDDEESLSIQVLETNKDESTQEEQSLTSTSSTLISFTASNNLDDGNLCGSWFGDYLSHSNNDDNSYNNDWSSHRSSSSSSSPSTPPRLLDSEYSTPTSSPHSISSKQESSCPSSASLESSLESTGTYTSMNTACDASSSSITPLEPPRLVLPPATRSSSSAANSNSNLLVGGIFAEPMCLLMTSNKDNKAPPPMRKLNSTSSSSSTAEGTSLLDDDEITVRVSNKRHKNKPMYYKSNHETKQQKNNPLHDLIHPGKDEFTNNAPFQLPNQETRSTTNKKPNNSSSNVFKKTSRKIKKILGKSPPRRHDDGSNNNGNPDPIGTPTTISTRTLATHKAVKHGSHRRTHSFDQLWLEDHTRETTIVHDDLQDVLMGKPFQVTKAKGGTRTAAVQQPVEPKSHVRLFPRKRFGSSDNVKSKPNSPSRKIINLIRQPSSGGTTGPVETSKTTWDDAIRGRLDGFDVLSLGKARNISFVNKTQKQFAGQRYTLRSMVTDMLWQSCCGSGTPEIVLEGFAPHGEDRWTVCVTKREEEDHAGDLTRRSNSTRLDTRTQKQTGSKEDKTHKWKELLPTTQEDHCSGDSWRELLPCCDDEAQFLGDNDMSVKHAQSHHKDMQSEMSLSQIMWGSDKHPPPTHSIRYEKSDDPGSNGTQFVAVSSCPIDVDKGTFIIKTNDHLQSVHKAAVAPLMHGRFSESIPIFETILKSLKLKYKHIDYLHHLVGSTHHNLGVLYMWSEQYEEALQHFKKAITVRSQIFCFHHPLVAVSLAKIGIVYFALEQLEKASSTLEKAVEIRKKLMKEDHLEIAKLFNNLGAVNYQKGDNKTALKKFTEALQIQKQCLDGIRRESLVHDSSNTLSNMGKVYLDLDDYDMAFYCFEEALMLQTASFRKDHDTILTSLGNIAFAKAKKGETTNALQVYKCLLRTQESKFGSQNRQAVETRGLMSVIYIQQKNHKSGIRCLGSVLQWQKQNLDKHHPAIKNTQETIAKMKQALSSKT